MLLGAHYYQIYLKIGMFAIRIGIFHYNVTLCYVDTVIASYNDYFHQLVGKELETKISSSQYSLLFLSTGQ